MVVYFGTNSWKQNQKIDKKEHSNLLIYLIIMSFAPFWWRYWQCINKWYYSGNRWQLVNSMKYMSKFGPAIVTLFGATKVMEELDSGADHSVKASYWPYFTTQMITTLFCLYWDYIWDWGLFQTTESGKFMLRDKMKFRPTTYYFCILLNTLLRFWWLLASFHLQYTDE